MIRLNVAIRIPGNTCPHCGEMADGVTAMNPGALPVPGSVGMCWYCGGLFLFADDLTLRAMDDAEMAAALSSPAVVDIMRARAMWEEREGMP